MAYGYCDRILNVDLSTGNVWTESPGEAFFRRHLGGRALVAHYLLQLVPAGADPLGADNVLVFAPGVLTGATVSGQGRNGVGARSPLTGALGSAEAGGYFGAELRRAGYDAIVVRGRAARPSYLWIQADHVELRDARHLWGRTVGDTEQALHEELGSTRIRTAIIGPAGENLVRFAAIANDRSHFAGRTGLGAVMGAKNLKAVAVLAPAGTSGPLQFFDGKALSAINRWLVENFRLVQSLHEHGTAGGLLGLNAEGGLPVRNFQAGSWEQAVRYSGEVLTDTLLRKRDTCASCAVRCKRVVGLEEPLRIDPRYGGPEYETLSAFGNNLGIADLPILAKASELCAAFGIDSISTGVTIGWAMELWQRGMLTPAETGGLRLEWGDAETVLRLVEMIARREGFGDVLAEGAHRAARRIGRGSERYVMHVKGQEFPLHEPRIKHALGLGFAVSPTGADHMHNMHDTIMTGDTRWWRDVQAWRPFGFQSPHGFAPEKLEIFYHHANYRHALDSLVMCHFLPYPPAKMAELVRAATGWTDFDEWALFRVGLRANTLSRMFNIREGFGTAQDVLPDRVFEPLADSRTGQAIARQAFAEARRWYYARMGWDPETGVPAQETLRALDIAVDL